MATKPDIRRRWTRRELILAFNLYCETPFGRIHNRNPAIIALAKELERTPSALSWKLANFARLDPTLQKRNIKGATHGSKEEEAVWEEFQSNWDKLALESERLRIGAKGLEKVEKELNLPDGRTREALVQVRVNQAFFRRSVLAAYNSTCCITGIQIQELLCASHVIPWAADTNNRTNPSNGLCLNALHDRAFDRGLITVAPDFKILVSKKIAHSRGTHLESMLLDFAGQRIMLPDRFMPRADFLAFHNEHIFQG